MLYTVYRWTVLSLTVSSSHSQSAVIDELTRVES